MFKVGDVVQIIFNKANDRYFNTYPRFHRKIKENDVFIVTSVNYSELKPLIRIRLKDDNKTLTVECFDWRLKHYHPKISLPDNLFEL